MNSFQNFSKALQAKAVRIGRRRATRQGQLLADQLWDEIESTPALRDLELESTDSGIILSARHLGRRLFARPSLRWIGQLLR